MIKSLLIPMSACLILLAGACSTTTEDVQADEWRTDARLGEKVDRICFRSSVDNFRDTTDNSVVVTRGVKDDYLIETLGYCRDLDHALSLSFSTFPGSGCITRGDSIYAFDSVFGPDSSDFPPIRCPISAIYKWDEEALDEEEDMDGEE